MTDSNNNGFDPFAFTRTLMDARQQFMPSGLMFSRIAMAGRHMSEAQIEYGQAMMRANTELLQALFNRSPAPDADERPSEAVKHSEPAE